jgi:hypothetical protein
VKREFKTGEELHDWIIAQVRQHSECSDFEAEFRISGLGKVVDSDPTWNIFGGLRNVNDWAPDCFEAFQRAVAGAQRRFDLKP